MNALLDKERAIVSHIPGTTRDIVEDHIRLNGLNIKLIDTAGIRTTEEVDRDGRNTPLQRGDVPCRPHPLRPGCLTSDPR